jgi:hypothetical protein
MLSATVEELTSQLEAEFQLQKRASETDDYNLALNHQKSIERLEKELYRWQNMYPNVKLVPSRSTMSLSDLEKQIESMDDQK